MRTAQWSLFQFLNVSNGVPQGSLLGPTLFTIYVNGGNQDASVHFYADDTIFIFELVFKQEQAFDSIQSQSQSA